MELRTRTIVSSPRFIEAEVHDDLLTIYRSVIVDDWDELFAPILDFLDGKKADLLIEFLSEDEDMMFGWGRTTVIVIKE